MATSDTTKARTRSGLPLGLTLALVQGVGVALVVVGVYTLVAAGSFLTQPFGLVVVLTGVDLLLRPGARRRPPQIESFVGMVLDRWKHPPAV